MAKLVVLTEAFKGRTYELKVDKTTIGRLEDNAFQIPEASVSSHHCEVLLRGNDVVIKDLNSTNGTFVNGRQITDEAVLQPGQILRLGQIEIRLDNGAPAKKSGEATRMVPGGVKIDQLDSQTRPVNFDKASPFSKKTNQANKVFVWVGVALGVVILALLVYALIKFGDLRR
jgi:pSer/pThr/pTyr-binding forkhead associated (FHA) protein